MNTSPFPVSRTRTGKIARLPLAVRSELNRRLEDGEPGVRLLAWLNDLPEVRAVLAEQFGGRPINDQNLCDWRQGGYEEWRQREEDRAWLQSMAEEEEELAPEKMGEALTSLALLELARLLRAAQAAPEGLEKCRMVFGVTERLCQLRRTAVLEGRLHLAEEEREAEEFAALEAQAEAAETKLQGEIVQARILAGMLRSAGAKKDARRKKEGPHEPSPETRQADKIEAHLAKLQADSRPFKAIQAWVEGAPASEFAPGDLCEQIAAPGKGKV